MAQTEKEKEFDKLITRLNDCRELSKELKGIANKIVIIKDNANISGDVELHLIAAIHALALATAANDTTGNLMFNSLYNNIFK